MNNNQNTERGLRGVFSTASYIDVGEKARRSDSFLRKWPQAT